MGKSRKGSDRKSNMSRQKNKRGDIEKWDQTEALRFKMGGDIRNLQPPFGGTMEVDREREHYFTMMKTDMHKCQLSKVT